MFIGRLLLAVLGWRGLLGLLPQQGFRSESRMDTDFQETIQPTSQQDFNSGLRKPGFQTAFQESIQDMHRQLKSWGFVSHLVTYCSMAVNQVRERLITRPRTVTASTVIVSMIGSVTERAIVIDHTKRGSGPPATRPSLREGSVLVIAGYREIAVPDSSVESGLQIPLNFGWVVSEG